MLVREIIELSIIEGDAVSEVLLHKASFLRVFHKQLAIRTGSETDNRTHFQKPVLYSATIPVHQ